MIIAFLSACMEIAHFMVYNLTVDFDQFWDYHHFLINNVYALCKVGCSNGMESSEAGDPFMEFHHFDDDDFEVSQIIF